MKKFKSFLSVNFEEYIRYRESLGYQESRNKCYLASFDRFITRGEVGWCDLKPKLFFKFIKQLDLAPLTVNRTISSLRGFFSYLQRIEIVEENPLKDIVGKKIVPYIPFIFSEKDTRRLLDAINRKIRKNPKNYFRDYTIFMVILLLVRCGLRISEPLSLKINDYRICEGTIFIQNTKFNKDRLIPVPISAMQELSNYLSARRNFVNNPNNPHLFPGKQMFRIDRGAVYSVFYQAVEDIGIKQEKKSFDNIRFGKSTPHSLRHSFAVNTLLRIKANGKSAQDALPVLAAYMGHKNYQSTAVYLKALDAKHRRGLFDTTIKHFNAI